MEYTLSGPYFKYSSPYGTFSTCHRNIWYLRSEDKVWEICQYVGQENRFILPCTWPIVEACSLEEIIKRCLSGEQFSYIS